MNHTFDSGNKYKCSASFGLTVKPGLHYYLGGIPPLESENLDRNSRRHFIQIVPLYGTLSKNFKFNRKSGRKSLGVKNHYQGFQDLTCY